MRGPKKGPKVVDKVGLDDKCQLFFGTKIMSHCFSGPSLGPQNRRKNRKAESVSNNYSPPLPRPRDHTPSQQIDFIASLAAA